MHSNQTGPQPANIQPTEIVCDLGDLDLKAMDRNQLGVLRQALVHLVDLIDQELNRPADETNY